jgi:hypothetical protein
MWSLFSADQITALVIRRDHGVFFILTLIWSASWKILIRLIFVVKIRKYEKLRSEKIWDCFNDTRTFARKPVLLQNPKGHCYHYKTWRSIVIAIRFKYSLRHHWQDLFWIAATFSPMIMVALTTRIKRPVHKSRQWSLFIQIWCKLYLFVVYITTLSVQNVA